MPSQIKAATTPRLSFTPSRNVLQRKCACGGRAGPVGECEECRHHRLQRSPTHHTAPSTMPSIVHDVLSSSGEALNANTRAWMETRFGDAPVRPIENARVQSQLTLSPADDEYERAADARAAQVIKTRAVNSSERFDFSGVRIHADARAIESARAMNALAYTVGRDIVFGAGQYAPETEAGRRLIAHELTHVVQQSNAGTARGQPLQRQPDETSTKETPPTQTPSAKAPPRKTLKSEGVDLNDPVAGGTAAIIDTVLARNQKLAPYIGARIKGLKIAEKGKFVHETNDVNFDNAYRDAYDLSSGDTVPKSTKGFLNTKKSEIHLRPDALFGTALHEAVHRLASPRLYGEFLPIAKKISSTLTDVLSEGVTAFFTDEILKEEELPNFNDAYRSKKDKAKNLIDALKPDGFDMMGNFNFKGSGIVEIGEKLGFTRKQYGDAKDDGIKEVLKRMEKVL
jgi:hypothetical protein